jgi:hypothetical protein
MTRCPKCSVERFSWDGGVHRCLVIDNSRVEFSYIASRVVDKRMLAWLQGVPGSSMPDSLRSGVYL